MSITKISGLALVTSQYLVQQLTCCSISRFLEVEVGRFSWAQRQGQLLRGLWPQIQQLFIISSKIISNSFSNYNICSICGNSLALMIKIEWLALHCHGKCCANQQLDSWIPIMLTITVLTSFRMSAAVLVKNAFQNCRLCHLIIRTSIWSIIS